MRMLQPQHVADFMEQRLVARTGRRQVAVLRAELPIVEVDVRARLVIDQLAIRASVVGGRPGALAGDICAGNVLVAEMHFCSVAIGGLDKLDASERA